MGPGRTQSVDVAIIGAGWYGLVAARTYLRLRPGTTLQIIDSDSTVGGVWSEARLYPNLVAQVTLGLFNYSDAAMPAGGGGGRGDAVTGRMIHDYLHKYAEDHDLLRRVRFNTHVQTVQRDPRGGWLLRFANGADALRAAKLLVATGVTSIPSMPPGVSRWTPSVPVVHSRDLGAALPSPKQRQDDKRHGGVVVVVGAAKSAYDAVYLLLSQGRRVAWVIRPHGAGPLAILPARLLGGAWSSIGVVSTRLMTGLSPSVLNTTGPLYAFFQRTAPGRWLAGAFWDALAALSDLHAGYHRGGHVAMLRPEIGSRNVFWANSGLGIVTLPAFWRTIREGDVAIHRDEPAGLEGDTLFLKSGAAVRADAVVLCTGWGDHFAMFDDALKTELGLPVRGGEEEEKPMGAAGGYDWDAADRRADAAVDAKLPMLKGGPARAPEQRERRQERQQQQQHWRLYRRVVPLALAERGDRSLAILGQIHTVQTPLVAEVQSFWAVLYLLGELDPPGRAAMVREVAEWNAWTRKRYLSQGRKFPYSLYDFLPYIDALCGDLGINSRRKSNVFAELFAPYRPSDFRGFIDEYFANKRKVASPAAVRKPLALPPAWMMLVFCLLFAGTVAYGAMGENRRGGTRY